jgi:hypothetical protein
MQDVVEERAQDDAHCVMLWASPPREAVAVATLGLLWGYSGATLGLPWGYPAPPKCGCVYRIRAFAHRVHMAAIKALTNTRNAHCSYSHSRLILRWLAKTLPKVFHPSAA